MTPPSRHVDPGRVDDLLSKTAATLDIPDFVYEDAVLKYDDVAAWLADEDSGLSTLVPEIYPQGSFRIGTVVRPLVKQSEFDIDLVCLLQTAKEQTSQVELKAKVGGRLSARSDLSKLLEEKRRCWTLNYSGDNGLPDFHMDILPAIPNPSSPPSGILITDTKLARWQESNPIAYSEWFFDRMKDIFAANRLEIAESQEVEVYEVSDWRIKTPLQVAIQLLKRHRDIHFASDESTKPSSILVTTLAALSYGNQSSVLDALVDISERMPGFLEKRRGTWWLPNPVDAQENFADKWNDAPSCSEAFQLWISRLQADVHTLVALPSLDEAVRFLASILGEAPIRTAASQLGIEVASTEPVILVSEPQVPELATVDHTQSPPWPLKLEYKSRIRGTVHSSKTSKKLWNLSGKPVPKKVWLHFEVTTTAPAPYTVKWQVVNSGEEAMQADGLRGDFYDSQPQGSSTRWETTFYLGTHWIEAFIIKDNVCVSRSSRKYVRVR